MQPTKTTKILIKIKPHLRILQICKIFYTNKTSKILYYGNNILMITIILCFILSHKTQQKKLKRRIQYNMVA